MTREEYRCFIYRRSTYRRFIDRRFIYRRVAGSTPRSLAGKAQQKL